MNVEEDEARHLRDLLHKANTRVVLLEDALSEMIRLERTWGSIQPNMREAIVSAAKLALHPQETKDEQ